MIIGSRKVLVLSYGRVPLLPVAHPQTRTTRPTASRPPGPVLPLVTILLPAGMKYIR